MVFLGFKTYRCYAVLLVCSPVGETMGKRGRPAILKDRKTTTVSIEGEQFKFALDENIDLSKLLRDTLDVLRRNKETPIEKMKRDLADKLEQIKELEIQANQLETMIKDAEDAQVKALEEGKEQDELETKRKNYFINYKEKVSPRQKCSRLWLEYLTDGLGFATFDEAKTYAKDVWVDAGMAEETANVFLRLN